MKKNVWLIAVLAMVLPLMAGETGSEEESAKLLWRISFDVWGKQKVELESDPSRNSTTPVFGFNIGLASLKKSGFKLEGQLGMHYIDTEELNYLLINNCFKFDLQVGARFLPGPPTFRLGKIQCRPTFSALGGITMTYSEQTGRFGLTSCMSGGFFFSGSNRLSGPMVEIVVWPFREKIRGFFIQNPNWAIRISWIFAPAK